MDLITIEEASDLLHFSKKSIYNKVYKREIPYIKIGRRLLFDKKDLSNWVDRNKFLPK